MRVIVLMVSIFLAVSTAVNALTLEEAVALALQSDDSIKQNEYLLESQKYTSRSAVAAFLPAANLKYSYSDTDLRDKKLPNANSKSSAFTVELGMNIFNGLGDIRTYQIGKKSYEVQGYAYRSNVQDVVLATKSAYIGYLKGRMALDVAAETLKLLETQKEIAEVSYSVGQFSKSDVLRVDVQLASAHLDYLNAQINQKLARQQLEKAIGRPLSNNDVVMDIIVKDNYDIPSLDELYVLMEDESDMRSLKGGYEISVLNKNKSLSGFMPSVNLGYSYAWNGDNSNPFKGVDKLVPGANYDRSATIAVTATWNIFSGLYNYNDYMSKSVAAEASSYNISNKRKDMRLQLSSYYESYFSARERLAVAKVAVEQAKESYRVTESQYANSEATTTDLLSANIALTSAKNSYTSANYDVMLSVAQIERVTGRNLLGIDAVAK